jgi:sporulation protein YlmC with PRC-barrel domain
MALLKLKDLYPQMINRMRDSAIIGFTVYVNKNEKVGTVKDILVDEDTGKFQYLIVDLGLWIFGKEVLLPIERVRVSAIERRVDAEELTKEQAESLPQFTDDLKIDRDDEARVSNGDRPANNHLSIQPAPIAPIDPMVLNTTATLNEPS